MAAAKELAAGADARQIHERLPEPVGVDLQHEVILPQKLYTEPGINDTRAANAFFPPIRRRPPLTTT
ncbi:hypothetical protein D3C83_105460 [compost metagenome]